MEVTLHNRASEIALAHQALDEMTARHELPTRPIARLHLALEEHLTNIISHGYESGRGGTITVRFALEPSALSVEIADDARPFNLMEAPEANTGLSMEKKPLGGLGILMIRKSVDVLEYRFSGGRNVLVMKNRLMERPDIRRSDT